MKNQEDKIKEELKAIAPFLADKLNNEDGFNVPIDYFEMLSDNIMEEVGWSAKTESDTLKTIQTGSHRKSIQNYIDDWINYLLGKPQYILAFAALVGLIITSSIFLNRSSSNNMAELEGIESYIEENIDDFSVEMILDVAMFDGEQLQVPMMDIEDEILQEYIEDNILNDIDEEFIQDVM